ncbi:hypothetical protein ACLOJK_016915 [Asimina triloba]
MRRNTGCTVYVGNLDEKVSERALYEILVQAGRIVDLHVPRDKDTNRPRGFAFAEYESEEIAEYAVRLFSGLVSLYSKPLKFAISRQDRPLRNMAIPGMPSLNLPPVLGSLPMQIENNDNYRCTDPLPNSCRFSARSRLNNNNFDSNGCTHKGILDNI